MNKPIMTIFLLIISVIVVVLFAIPEYRQVKGLQVKLAAAKAQNKGQADYIVTISQLAGELDARSDALAKIDSALPIGFSVAPIIYFLGNTAATHALTIQSVEIVPENPTAYSEILAEENKNATQIMAFTARIIGPYKNIRDFIATVEASARVFEISTISVKPVPTTKGATKNPSYEAVLEIKTHAY